MPPPGMPADSVNGIALCAEMCAPPGLRSGKRFPSRRMAAAVAHTARFHRRFKLVDGYVGADFPEVPALVSRRFWSCFS